MPVFELQAPDGGVYEIDAPDERAALGAFQKIGGQQPQQEKSMLQGMGETLSDATTGVVQGATLGFGDELLSAALTPFEMARGAIRGTDEGKGIGQRVGDAYSRALEFNRGLDKQAAERSPIASTAGEIVGGAVTGGGLARGGVSLLNAAKPTYKSMIGRGAAEGAAYGGVYGAGTGEGMEDRLGRAATGAAVGAVTGGVMGGVGARQASKAASASTPTLDELRAASKIAYDEAKNANVVVQPQRYKKMVDDLYQDLVKGGVDPGLHPGVTRAFDRLRELESQPVAFETLDILRRVANSAGKSLQNRDEGRLAGLIVDKVDDLMNNLGPRDVLSGDGRLAGEMIRAGRALWSRVRKSEALEELVERATNKVGANYTAAGFQTAIRQEVKSLLNNKKALRGFSEQERNMLKALNRGASVENVLRQLGKFAPRGIVSTTLSGGAGFALGGPAGAAAVMGGGEAAKQISARMTQAKLTRLIEAVRRGGPRVLQALPAEQRAAVEAAIAAMTPAQEAIGVYPQRPSLSATP